MITFSAVFPSQLSVQLFYGLVFVLYRSLRIIYITISGPNYGCIVTSCCFPSYRRSVVEVPNRSKDLSKILNLQARLARCDQVQPCRQPIPSYISSARSRQHSFSKLANAARRAE